jgi:GNAT superfamily N-acetyltransferase
MKKTVDARAIRATELDRDLLISLIDEYRQEAKETLAHTDSSQFVSHLLRHPHFHTSLIRLSDERCVGFILCIESVTALYLSRSLMVTDVWLTKDVRGTGVLRTVIDQLIRDAELDGHFSVFLQCAPEASHLVAHYERMGFTCVNLQHLRRRL